MRTVRLVRAATARLRAKFTGDAAFAKRVDDAVSTRDLTAATTLVASVAQVRPDQVWIGESKKQALGSPIGATLFRFASNERGVGPLADRFNPWYVLIVTKAKAYCVGTSKDECRAALKAAGYTPLN